MDADSLEETPPRPTLGDRLVARLEARTRRRPRIGMSPAFFARLGLADPWTESADPEADPDGLVYLSGADWLASLAGLARARWRRERRTARFLDRRAGTRLRALGRRWPGESAGIPTTLSGLRADAFILPPPLTPEVPAEAEAATGRRPTGGRERRRRSEAWAPTRNQPAHVVRGDVDSGARRAAALPPMQAAGARLVRAAAAEELARVHTPTRRRGALAAALEIAEAPEALQPEVRRRLRRRTGAAPEAWEPPERPSVRRRLERAVRPTRSTARQLALPAPPSAAGDKVALSRSPVARAPRVTRRRAAAAPAPRAADAAAPPAAGSAPSAPARTLPPATAELQPPGPPRRGRPAPGRAPAPAPEADAPSPGGAPLPSPRPAGPRRPAAVAADAESTPRHAPPAPQGAPTGPRPAPYTADLAFGAEAEEDAFAPTFERPSPASRALARWVAAPAAAAGEEPFAADTPEAVAHAPTRRALARGATPAAGSLVPRPVSARPTLTLPPPPEVETEADPALPTAPRTRPPRVVDGWTGRERPRAAAPPAPGAPPREPARSVGGAVPTGAGAVRAPSPAHATGPARPSAPTLPDRTGTGLPSPSVRRGVAPALPFALPTAEPSAAAADPAAAAGPAARPARVARPASSPPPPAGDTPDAVAAYAPRRAGRRVPAAWAASLRADASTGPVDLTLPGQWSAERPRESRFESRGPLAWVGLVRDRGAYVPAPATARVVRPRGVARTAPAAGTSAPVEPAALPLPSALRRLARPLAWSMARGEIVYASAFGGALGDGLPESTAAAPAAAGAGLARPGRRPRAAATSTPLPSGDAGPRRPPSASSGPASSPAEAEQALPAEAPARPARALARASFADLDLGLPAEDPRPVEVAEARMDAPSPAPVLRRPDRVVPEMAPVTPMGLGPEAETDAEPGGPSLAGPGPRPRTGTRAPLARRLHALASDRPVAGGWAARAQGAPPVRTVGTLFEALARATTTSDVVRVIFERSVELREIPAEVQAPITQVVRELKAEVAEDPSSLSRPVRAAAPVERASRAAAPAAETLRTGESASAPRRAVRVPARGGTSGARAADDRVSRLVRRLQELILLAESNQREAARRQVRMAEDTAEARSEGGQGEGGDAAQGEGMGGPQPGHEDAGRFDIDALGREMMEMVSRELELRRERRMEDRDESGWW